MWDSRLYRRISLGLALSLALITLSTCGSTKYPPASTCIPLDDPKKPRICVDSAGEPNPKAQKADNYVWKLGPIKNRVDVTWRADIPATKLVVEFVDESCVEKKDVKCTGLECTAKIKKIKWDDTIPDDQEKRDCRYKTTLTIDGKEIDPWGELIVNPCCM